MADFVYLFRSGAADYREAMGTPEQAQRSVQDMMDWIDGLEASGRLKDRGQPLDRAGAVVGGGRATVIDGPYIEAKDIVLGFIIVEARDLDEAVALAGECPMALGGATVEVRPVMASPLPADA